MKLKYNLFYVNDVPATMDFYEKAFGLTKGFLHPSNQYGEMITGETSLGFVHHETASSHGFQYLHTTTQGLPPAFEIGFVTDDVAKAFTTALQGGAIAVSAPTTKPWGQTVSYVKDLNGFLVEICSAMG